MAIAVVNSVPTQDVPEPQREQQQERQQVTHTKETGQLLNVTVDPNTGNYIFHYTAYDGTPIEHVFIPATKITPMAHVEFSFDPIKKLTSYAYQISNGPKSRQELSDFKVKVIPPAENLRWPKGWKGHKPRSPTNVVSWFQLEGATFVEGYVQPRGLAPGKSQAGFSFESPNLPGVATAYFQGNTPETRSPPGITHEVRQEMSKYTWWEYDSVRKPTIGPAIQVNDLDPYDAGMHLQRLETHLAEQVPEELLSNKKLRADVKRALARARQALQAAHPDEALNQLVALRRRLSEAAPSDVSEEFRQALLINLDYILAKLPR